MITPKKGRNVQMPGLEMNLQPMQALFNYLMENSPASWLGYGGSRGGAKSGCARRVAVRRCAQYPGTRRMILRRVWDDVYKNHVLPMFEEFPQLVPFYKDKDHSFNFPNGSILFMDSAENEGDVRRKAFGPEFMDLFVDQAEQFTEAELKQIKTIVRWPNTPSHRCKFGLFFNPGGVSAQFLQRIFHLHDYIENESPDDYAFIQAYGWDNIEWCRPQLELDGFSDTDFYNWTKDDRFNYFIKYSQYGQEMDRLPAQMRAGQLLGNFDKFAGQYFSNWNPKLHVWPVDQIIWQPHWPRWISFDWGFKHAAVAGWHCQAGFKKNEDSIPLTITYRVKVYQGLSERALAEEICSANGKDKIINVFGGHDLWAKENSGPTKEEAMSEVFRRHGLPSLKHATIDRVDGWRLMHRMLDEGEWIITDNCRELVAAIPTAVFNEKDKAKNEDVLKTNDMHDDVRDMARYGLYSQYGPKAEPFSKQIQAALSHLKDDTVRNIQAARMQSMHEKGQDKRTAGSRSGGRYDRYMGQFRGGRV